MSAFPAHFAIVRTLSTRGPYWQLLESKYISSGLPSDQAFYEIYPHSIFGGLANLDEVVFSDVPSWMERKTLAVRTEGGELRIQKYWKFPMMLLVGNSQFPILHFEYKAWLPRPASRLSISNHTQVLQTYNDYVRRLRVGEDEVRRRLFDTLPRRPPTPPILSRSTSPVSTDSDDAQSVMTVYPSFDPLQFPPLPPSPSISPSPPKPLPIPYLVGSLLIENAKSSEDACPISTIPYKELLSLTATSCFHVFDTQSIQIWLRDHQQCPVCRNSIANMITKEVKN